MRSRDRRELGSILERIDGRGYKAYQELEGSFAWEQFLLEIDHVQRDPFAAPSRFCVTLSLERAGFPPFSLQNRIRRLALGDFLARAFRDAIPARGRRGSGSSGLLSIDAGGQEVLERNCVEVGTRQVEARFTVGLPAAGRRVLGGEAERLILEEIPAIVARSLFFSSLDEKRLMEHIRVVEDQEAMRRQLEEKGLVAFVANGSVLPRRSGVDDRPLLPGPDQLVVPFESPPELEVELERPHAGRVRGLGIPRGVTLIAGGGFHGKSTLLRALERGIYNHRPGDGREGVVSLPSAVKIRAEDGRFVEKVDISPFIDHLPLGRDTIRFSTPNASGSTSQAANIMEALEVGARLLLLDEDTSATNFIIRDARMQALVPAEKEPITPFLDKVRPLFEEHGVSTVMVMGGSGDYFEVADQVLVLENYRPLSATGRAREIARTHPTGRQRQGGPRFGSLPRRRPRARSFDASRGRRSIQVTSRGIHNIRFGRSEIDLSALEQLVDPSQTRAIAQAILLYSRRYLDSQTLLEGLKRMDHDLDAGGLDRLTRERVGNLARPRLIEIALAINRLRTLSVA